MVGLASEDSCWDFEKIIPTKTNPAMSRSYIYLTLYLLKISSVFIPLSLSRIIWQTVIFCPNEKV